MRASRGALGWAGRCLGRPKRLSTVAHRHLPGLIVWSTWPRARGGSRLQPGHSHSCSGSTSGQRHFRSPSRSRVCSRRLLPILPRQPGQPRNSSGHWRLAAGGGASAAGPSGLSPEPVAAFGKVPFTANFSIARCICTRSWTVLVLAIPVTIRSANFQGQTCKDAMPPTAPQVLPWAFGHRQLHLRSANGRASSMWLQMPTVGVLIGCFDALTSPNLHWSNTGAYTPGRFRIKGHGCTCVSHVGQGFSAKKYRPARSCASATRPQNSKCGRSRSKASAHAPWLI